MKIQLSKRFQGVAKLNQMNSLAWECLQKSLLEISPITPRGSVALAFQSELVEFPSHLYEVEPSSRGGSSGSGAANEPQTPQLADDGTLHRAEEAAFREWLSAWTEQDLTFVPLDHCHDWEIMMSMLQEYMVSFNTMKFHEIVRSDSFPTSLRVWTSATVSALYELGRRRLIPKWITTATDSGARAAANQAPAGYQDPGNVILDMFIHVTAFWNLMSDRSIERFLRVHGSYGSNANKSSHGPVNLRGNVVEGLLGHLQKVAGAFRQRG